MVMVNLFFQDLDHLVNFTIILNIIVAFETINLLFPQLQILFHFFIYPLIILLFHLIIHRFVDFKKQQQDLFDWFFQLLLFCLIIIYFILIIYHNFHQLIKFRLETLSSDFIILLFLFQKRSFDLLTHFIFHFQILN